MKLTPLADNVLLKSFEAEEKTASGIILSTATKEKSVVSEVVAAGPGTDDVKMTVKKGDKVMGGFEMNEGMMQMMGGFTVLRLSGMMGTMGINLTKEDLLGLNAKLNKIKKP